MDWLKDKKNQPVVAAIAALVILAVGFCVWFFVLRTPAAPDAGATQPAAATGNVAASVQPMEPFRPDPFLPPGYRPPKDDSRIKRPIRDLPIAKIDIPGMIPGRDNGPKAIEYPQPVRRMAGLILGDKVYAIIETAGKNEVVQPGDMLADRLAMVDRIETDKVILKTIDKPARYLTVRMSQGVRTTELNQPSSSGPGTGGRPRGPRGPYGGLMEAPPAPM